MKLYLLIISMGGGILPIAFKNGKIYFLFGRETIDIWKDSGLWSDFGGGKEKNETYKETAIREGWEETDGVLGNLKTIEYLIENMIENLSEAIGALEEIDSNIEIINVDEE